MQNFRLIVHIDYLFLHGFCLHYNVWSGLSVKQEVNYKTMHYPGRKQVYLQIFELIGAMVSEFRFFRTKCNEGLITSELKGLTKKLSFSIPSRYKV